MKLSLIPTKLLKSKDSENEYEYGREESSSNDYYYYDEDEQEGSSNEEEQDDSSKRPSYWETGIDIQFT